MGHRHAQFTEIRKYGCTAVAESGVIGSVPLLFCCNVCWSEHLSLSFIIQAPVVAVAGGDMVGERYAWNRREVKSKREKGDDE